MILTLASSKGGVGRTTLAAALAVEAAARGISVTLVDLDPQQALVRWHQLRGDDDRIRLFNGCHNPEKAITRARRTRTDVVILDAPTSLVRMQYAIDAATLVIAPLRPSPLDIEAVRPTVDMCDARGALLGFLLNSVVPNSSMTVGARRYLSDEFGGVLEPDIQSREIYASAMLEGKSAAEVDATQSARREIELCWNAIDSFATGMPQQRMSGRAIA